MLPFHFTHTFQVHNPPETRKDDRVKEVKVNVVTFHITQSHVFTFSGIISDNWLNRFKPRTLLHCLHGVYGALYRQPTGCPCHALWVANYLLFPVMCSSAKSFQGLLFHTHFTKFNDESCQPGQDTVWRQKKKKKKRRRSLQCISNLTPNCEM